jgi:2Fe-2S ferredoxin
MPKIQFTKDIAPITVASGAQLMTSLLDAGLPVASSCYGKGICSKCRVQIISGAENLSIETDNEKQLRERNKIADGNRISCQTKVIGDVTIDASYW